MSNRVGWIVPLFLLATVSAAVELEIGTVWVDVQPINDLPRAVRDAATTQEDTAVVVDVLANDIDPEGDAIHVARVWKPRHGSVNLGADGRVTYTPEENFSGLDWFTYAVSDRPTDLADLEVALAVDNASPNPGEAVTFTVTLTNNGPDEATGITVRYVPAEGFQDITHTPSIGAFADGVWMIDALPAGAEATLVITGTAISGGQ